MNSAISLKLFCENRKFIEKEISIRTSDLLTTGRFFYGEYDDIFSQLKMEVINSLDRYDSSRGGVLSYVKGVLKKKGIDLIRRRKTTWRQYGEFISTDDIFQNIELGKARNFSEFFIVANESEVVLHEIDTVISEFSPELRMICLLLEDSCNACEIAKILGKSRTTINKKINEIRKKLKKFR